MVAVGGKKSTEVTGKGRPFPEPPIIRWETARMGLGGLDSRSERASRKPLIPCRSKPL